MNNQVYSWALFLVPWLTLVFMKREEIKRYMPVTILAALVATIIHDVGINYGFWEVLTPSPPLYQMLPYYYGLLPLMAMWIFKFTNGRIWRYIVANLAFDVFFAYYFLGVWLPAQGLFRLTGITSFQVLLINVVHFSVLYVYQKWQEGELLPVRETSFNKDLNPVAAKPFPKRERE